MATNEKQKIAQELDKATKLKTYLVSDDPAIEALVEKYLAIIKETRNATRSHDSKYRDQLHILICNLVWVNTKKNLWIYQGRGKPTYRQTRYFSELTKAVFVDGILDTLVTLNLIEQKLGYKPKPEKEELVPSEPQKPRLTRIRAKGRLKADIKKISPHGIAVDSSRETLWVQVTTKSWFDKVARKTIKIKAKLDYEDNDKTRQMRSNLRIINQKLEKTFIGLWIKDTEYRKLNAKLKKSSEIELNFNDKYLDRIFNNTDFTHGGRFYHGWWQGIPRFYRPYITINHQVVIELDYKHIHPAMLYNEVGINELPKDFDAYTLDIEGFNKKHRKALKKVFQCLINNDSEESALNSIRSKGLAKSFAYSPKELMEEMIKKHTPIKELLFNKEMGKQLQKIDSDIAEYCILEMINRYGALILPVHDSFLIQQDRVQLLKKMMIEAYSKFVRGSLPIDEGDIQLWHPYEGLKHDDVHLYKKYQDQALLHLKRFNKDTNEPFMAPDVFPESYEDDCLIEL